MDECGRKEAALSHSQKQSSPRGSHSNRVEEVTEAFEHHYREYQYRFVEFFIEHISDVGRPFNGDLQAVLVLAVLGQSWLKAARAATKDGTLPEALPAERLSISASRIADITGIPRQTVRRKLEALEGRGWIIRDADGSCRLASSNGATVVKRDLSEIDCRALLRVARLYVDLESIVTKATCGR
jgi:hypothetical protein